MHVPHFEEVVDAKGNNNGRSMELPSNESKTSSIALWEVRLKDLANNMPKPLTTDIMRETINGITRGSHRMNQSTTKQTFMFDSLMVSVRGGPRIGDGFQNLHSEAKRDRF